MRTSVRGRNLLVPFWREVSCIPGRRLDDGRDSCRVTACTNGASVRVRARDFVLYIMAPRQAKPVERVLPNQTLIIDNGAHTMKAGFATSTPSLENCQVIPNCLAKDRGKHVWVGSSLEKCNDFGEIAFRRPVEKGFLVNWEAEKAVWDHTFFEKNAKLAVILRYKSLMVQCTECLEVRPSNRKSHPHRSTKHASVTPD